MRKSIMRILLCLSSWRQLWRICVGEQISNSFVPQFMGADVEIMQANANSHAGADSGIPCASVLGGARA